MKVMPIIPSWILIIILVAVLVLFILCLSKKKYRNIDNFRRIGILILIVMVMFRPVIRGGTSEAQLTNINVYFLIDSTNSMAVKDCDNGELRRYEKMSNDIKEIAKQFPGAQYSIIAQDISTYIALPLSTSIDALYSYANAVIPKSEYYSSGSSISALFDLAADNISTYAKEHPDRVNVLFVMSDGEETKNSNDLVAAKSLQKLVATGAILGYGTKDGGQIPSVSYKSNYSDDSDYFDENRPIMDENYRKHISRIDESALNNYAKALGVSYYNRANGTINTSLGDEVMKNAKTENIGAVETYTETYWIIALALNCLILWDFYSVFNKVLLERKAK